MTALRLSIVLMLVMIPVTSTMGASRHQKALKMLKLLKEVDGEGSGLDADTVRGLVPLVMVDAGGRVVGTWLGPVGMSPTIVVRRLDGHPVQLFLTAAGFVQRAQFFYDSSDCSGDRLMMAIVDFMPPVGRVLGATAYYPIGSSVHPTGSFSAQPSTESDCAGILGTFLPPDTCCSHIAESLQLGVATPFDLGSLGFVPPFHVDVTGP